MAAAWFVVMLVAGGVSLAAAAARLEISLPDYDAAAIGAGQSVEAASSYRNIREGGIPVQMAERVDTTALGEYLAKLGERFPDIRSVFNVYLIENHLIYVKKQCTRDDVAARFFLNVDPMSPDDLPDHRRPYGFDYLGFQFGRYGARFGRTCVTGVSLPDYDIAAIRTGQYVEAAGGYQNIWEEGIPVQLAERVDTTALREYLAKLGERFPDIRSVFNVYLIENHLIYVKKQCTRDDVAARFFLNVDPMSPDDLPDHRRPYGFDYLGFQFGRYGARFGRTCVTGVSLPDYDIAAIRTGQYVEAAGGYQNIWEGGIPVQLAERVDTTALGEYLAKLGERRLVTHSGIDVHLIENRLIYVKEQCTRDDVAARLFLHVYPVSPDDLPAHREPPGFDNLSFRFDQYGPGLGGTCVTEVSLPDYDIAAIRTGQYVKAARGYRNIWEGEIRLE